MKPNRTAPRELKPCPFCGGEAKERRIDEEDRSILMRISCWDCDAEMSSYLAGGSRSLIDETKADKLRDDWNRRTSTPITQNRREEIGKICDQVIGDLGMDKRGMTFGWQMIKNACFMSAMKAADANPAASQVKSSSAQKTELPADSSRGSEQLKAIAEEIRFETNRTFDGNELRDLMNQLADRIDKSQGSDQ